MCNYVLFRLLLTAISSSKRQKSSQIANCYGIFSYSKPNWNASFATVGTITSIMTYFIDLVFCWNACILVAISLDEILMLSHMIMSYLTVINYLTVLVAGLVCNFKIDGVGVIVYIWFCTVIECSPTGLTMAM